MPVIVDIALITVIGVGIMSNFFGLPGNILIALSTLFMGITTGFNQFSVTFILTVFAVLLAFELVEFVMISFTARRFGSSRWGIVGGIIGGLLGAATGAFFTPILSVIICSIIGVFIGAFSLEFIKQGNLKSSLRSGLGAFIGKIGGVAVKTIGALTMGIMILQRAL